LTLCLAADGLLARVTRALIFFSHAMGVPRYKVTNKGYHNGHV